MIELSEEIFKNFTAYALYKLPFAKGFSIVVQRSPKLSTVNKIEGIDSMKGFLMIPFAVSERYPIVCIRPEERYSIDFHRMPDIEVSGKSSDELMRRSKKDEIYDKVFDRFSRALRSGRFEKLVLSRMVSVSLSRFDGIELFLRACKYYPRMMVYLCYTPISGMWLGCTPELLLSGKSNRYKTVALAGTVSMEHVNGQGPQWTEKERREQRIVADYIKKCLGSYCIDIEEKEPCNCQAGELFHLQSEFTFSLRKHGDLGKFIECLYPTPAVCGIPKKEALRFIIEHEGYERKYYSGAIGMFDAEGGIDLYVNLRCAHLYNNTAELYAGGGLLDTSTADSEWNETEDKLKTITDVLKQA